MPTYFRTAETKSITMPYNLVQKIENTGKVTFRTVENVGDVAANFLFIPVILFQNAFIIGIIALLGFGLVFARDLLIISCPFLAKMSVIIAGTINMVVDQFIITITSLIDVVKGIIAAVKFFEGKKPHPHFTKYKLLHLSAEDVRVFFTNLPAECEDYTNIGYTLSEATKRTTNELFCPLVRVTYPVSWMWDTTNTVFGWGITNAVPQGTYIVNGYDGNCEFRDHPPNWLCIALSSGYVIVDVLLPLTLVAILWPVTFGPVLHLAYKETVMGVQWALSWFFDNMSASVGAFQSSFKKRAQMYSKQIKTK